LKALLEKPNPIQQKELLKSLPKQVQYQTFNRILEYVESSNKIVLEGRRIVWVFPVNPKLRELLESSVRLKKGERNI